MNSVYITNNLFLDSILSESNGHLVIISVQNKRSKLWTLILLELNVILPCLNFPLLFVLLVATITAILPFSGVAGIHFSRCMRIFGFLHADSFA